MVCYKATMTFVAENIIVNDIRRSYEEQKLY